MKCTVKLLKYKKKKKKKKKNTSFSAILYAIHLYYNVRRGTYWIAVILV